MAKKFKLSPWHDGSVKPVHAGVYQRYDENWFSFWNGSKWMFGSDTIHGALKEECSGFDQNSAIWRGVLK